MIVICTDFCFGWFFAFSPAKSIHYSFDLWFWVLRQLRVRILLRKWALSTSFSLLKSGESHSSAAAACLSAASHFSREKKVILSLRQTQNPSSPQTGSRQST